VTNRVTCTCDPNRQLCGAWPALSRRANVLGMNRTSGADSGFDDDHGDMATAADRSIEASLSERPAQADEGYAQLARDAWAEDRRAVSRRRQPTWANEFSEPTSGEPD
jgi:hypothetical protein